MSTTESVGRGYKNEDAPPTLEEHEDFLTYLESGGFAGMLVAVASLAALLLFDFLPAVIGLLPAAWLSARGYWKYLRQPFTVDARRGNVTKVEKGPLALLLPSSSPDPASFNDGFHTPNQKLRQRLMGCNTVVIGKVVLKNVRDVDAIKNAFEYYRSLTHRHYDEAVRTNTLLEQILSEMRRTNTLIESRGLSGARMEFELPDEVVDGLDALAALPGVIDRNTAAVERLSGPPREDT